MSMDVFERDIIASDAFARQHLAQDLPPVPLDLSPYLLLALCLVGLAALCMFARWRDHGGQVSAVGSAAWLVRVRRRVTGSLRGRWTAFVTEVLAKAEDGGAPR